MITSLVADGSALVILLAFSAFFSSAETAMFSLSPIQIHRIRRHKPRTASQIEALLASRIQLLSSILIGNTLVNIAVAGLGFALASHFFPHHGESVAFVAITILLLVFGDIIPKRLAVRRPDILAAHYVGALHRLIAITTPARVTLNWITQAFEKHLQPRRPALTEAELLTAVDASHEEGVLNREERATVDGIIRLENLQASDVMTPRVDIVGINLGSDPGGFPETARKARFQFLPVYRGDLDHVEGFLDVARFLLSPSADIKDAVFPHFYVPDSAPLDTLLTTFQQQNRRVAIVIDEYGGTAGLITRGDILDEIVEFAGDEHGKKKLTIEPNGPDRWIVDGSVSLEEINYELDLSLSAEGADRIAGWVTAHAERIPKTGDMLDAQGCRVTVLQMRKHRITMVQVERQGQSEEGTPP